MLSMTSTFGLAKLALFRITTVLNEITTKCLFLALQRT